MIEMMFNEDKENLRTIIHSKSVIQNITYKLKNDLNTKSFMDNVVDNIENYDSMERMKKYGFKNDLTEMREVLNLLYRGLQSIENTRNKTAAEIVECCSVFPDTIGERLMKQLAYIPIMDLFYEKILYEEYLKKYVKLDEESMGTTQLKHQRDKLFKKTILSKLFPEDKEYINYELRNEYIEKLRKDYEGGRLKEIDDTLGILLTLYKNRSEGDKNILSIGITYWDKRNKLRLEEVEAFAEVIKALSGD